MQKRKKLVKWWLLAGLLILWFIGVIGVGMSVYSHPPPVGGASRSTATTAEVVASVFTVLGGLSVILTLYFNIWQSIETHERQTIENTFSLIQSWDDPALLDARRFTRELGDRQAQITSEQLVKEVKENSDLRQSVILLFNFIENVAYSMRTARVDAVAVRRSLGPALIGIYQRFLPWIADVNTRTPNYSRDMEEYIDLLRTPRERPNNRLEPTTSSVRSCLAPASGSGSGGALCSKLDALVFQQDSLLRKGNKQVRPSCLRTYPVLSITLS
jgi:hypothetical protein